MVPEERTLFAGFWGGVHGLHMSELIGTPARLTPLFIQALTTVITNVGEKDNIPQPGWQELSLIEKFLCWLPAPGREKEGWVGL